jgi:hypothetical protein
MGLGGGDAHTGFLGALGAPAHVLDNGWASAVETASANRPQRAQAKWKRIQLATRRVSRPTDVRAAADDNPPEES